MQIERLRKIAELNFCERCYHLYKALIEPSIKEILANPLAGWPETEAYLTAIIWKDANAYDYGKTVLLDFDYEELDDLPDKTNKELLLEIKKWPFRKKLDYLKKRGIIQENTYKLLEEGRKARNKIHKFNYEFSEGDLELFRVCSNIAAQLQTAICFQNLEPIRLQLINSIEEYCRRIVRKKSANREKPN